MRYWHPDINDKGDSQKDDDETFEWTGYFHFNMDTIPASKGLGWIAGAGRSELPDKGVDFLLSTNGKTHHIGPQHLRFAHEKTTGWFSVFASDKMTVNLDNVRLSEGEGRALTRSSHLISMGDLLFSFEWSDVDSSSYEHNVQLMRKDLGFSSLEHRVILEISPQSTHYEIGDFTIHKTLSHGQSRLLSTDILAGFHRPSYQRVVCVKHNAAANRLQAMETCISKARQTANMVSKFIPFDLSE